MIFRLSEEKRWGVRRKKEGNKRNRYRNNNEKKAVGSTRIFFRVENFGEDIKLYIL